MSQKGRSAGAQERAQEKAKDMAKAEKRCRLEIERAAAQRKKTAELIRSGKLKPNKAKSQTGVFALFSSLPHQPAIRRIDVVTDEHTTLKKYRINIVLKAIQGGKAKPPTDKYDVYRNCGLIATTQVGQQIAKQKDWTEEMVLARGKDIEDFI